MECIFDLQQLESACIEWQNRLRLAHWDIAIAIARGDDFNIGDSQGEVHYVLASRKATIKILDPIDYPKSPFLQDMEVAVVHELLHLHFATFEPEKGTLQDILMESTIDQLAGTLVQLKREGKETVP